MLRAFFCLFVVVFSAAFKAQPIEVKVLSSINAGDKPQWDKAMQYTSHSVYAAMPLSFSTAWFIQYKHDQLFLNQNAWSSAGAIGMGVGIATGIKFLVDRPRPFVTYAGKITQRDPYVGPHSFPSGHTTAAFASATVWSLSANKWYVTVMAYSYASLVGYSRMRLGVHYPSDVLAGAFIGTGSGYLSWYLVKKWRQKQKSPLPN
jgi:undecaprenyl-diphosphatase